MIRRDSDWRIPPEALGLLSTLLLVPSIGVLAGILLPIVARLKTADVITSRLSPWIRRFVRPSEWVKGWKRT